MTWPGVCEQYYNPSYKQQSNETGLFKYIFSTHVESKKSVPSLESD